MILKVIEDRVLVVPIPEEKESEKWWTMEVRTEKPIRWSVISVWYWRTLENWNKEIMDVKVGDIVYFTKYAPDVFTHEEKEYYSIKQSSILAINCED